MTTFPDDFTYESAIRHTYAYPLSDDQMNLATLDRMLQEVRAWADRTDVDLDNIDRITMRITADGYSSDHLVITMLEDYS